MAAVDRVGAAARYLDAHGSGGGGADRPQGIDVLALLFNGDGGGDGSGRQESELSPESLNALNDSQIDAIRYCLTKPTVAVIHGLRRSPPGTGKTTTVVELVRQFSRSGSSTLVAAPSNVAVDNLAERLVEIGIKVVRIGHPARISSAVQRVSLDTLVDTSDAAALARDVRSEMDALTTRLSKRDSKRGLDHEARGTLRVELRSLRKELRERENAAIRSVLQQADVVLGTLDGLSQGGPLQLLPSDHFDCCVIDEAGQALEASCWGVLLRAPRCVLAGDHLQLPPTVTSPEAVAGGLGVSLLERAVGRLPSSSVCLLDTQYRMHEQIMRWSSDQLYGGQLSAAPSVASRLLADISGVVEDENTSVAVVFIDTAGCGYDETTCQADTDDVSMANEGEADIVVRHCNDLVAAGVSEAEIGVITPYNGQVDILRNRLADCHPEIEIRSVDGFQGREKEAIIISLVRSNKRQNVGFLAEHRRLNVACTRAKRHLTIVADGDTIGSNKQLATLVDFLFATADVRSGFEYTDDVSIDGNLSMSRHQREATAPVDKERDRMVEKSNAVRRAAFESRFRSFETSADSEIQFEPDLNSFERLLVHELAEKFGYGHRSEGDGNARQIRVWKITDKEKSDADNAILKVPCDLGPENGMQSTVQPAVQSTEDADLTVVDTNIALVNPVHRKTSSTDRCDTTNVSVVDLPLAASEKKQNKDAVLDKLSGTPAPAAPATSGKIESAELKKEEKSMILCKLCNKHIPENNFDIHQVRCERNQRRAKKQGKSAGSATHGGPGEVKSKSRGSQARARGCVPSDSNEDAVLDAFAIDAKQCQFMGCVASITLVSSFCKHCNRTFCTTHGLPEVHGCANAAALAARRERHQAAHQRARSRAPAPPSTANRERLERRLKAALKDKEGERAKTKKDQKGKKKGRK